MSIAAVSSPALKFLDDRWDPTIAGTLDEPELLRYRSNLLGSDLRITNFAGGNTSSKVDELDPLTGQLVKVLWVKGSGGDLGSISEVASPLCTRKSSWLLSSSIKVKTRKTTW